jgi:glyoxylase-like metal-dependent hydrolase (beta-lactamase superfamily II)
MQVTIIPVTPLQQNCSVLRCPTTGLAAVVDPGGDIDRILAAVRRADAQVEKILLTHGHLDHAAGTAELAERLGVPIEGPNEADRFLLESLPQWCAQFGFPAARAFEPDRWLEDGDRVTFGEQLLEVRLCPGHTPGHVVFFHEADRLAIVGDVLFRGSIGRTDFPRGDHAALLASIRDKLWPLGDDVTFVPGHGPTSTFGEERRSNPFVRDR